MEEMEDSPAYERYEAVREYNNDFKDLYKDFQNAKTSQEADSIMRLMVEARDRMLEDIERVESEPAEVKTGEQR